MKIVIFDFDGVIVDTYGFCYELINAISPVTHEEYKKRFEGNINDAMKKVAPKGLSNGTFVEDYFLELTKCTPYAEVVDAIKILAKKYTLIVISSTVSPAIDTFLTTNNIRECFQDILGNDIEKSKIKKIHMVFEKYSVSPEDCVFVTDTLGDIKEAKHCGVRSIAVTWGYHTRETLEKEKPYAIIDDKKGIVQKVQESLT